MIRLVIERGGSTRRDEPEGEMLSGSSRTPPGCWALDAAIVMDSLRRLVQVLRSMGRTPEQGPRVTPAQRFVLSQIAAQPGQSLGELAGRTLTRESSVSEVVTRLVRRGFVERRTGAPDRRRLVLTLTPMGERVVATASGTVQERVVAGLRALPDETRRALADGFQAWLEASGLQDAPAPMFFESD